LLSLRGVLGGINCILAGLALSRAKHVTSHRRHANRKRISLSQFKPDKNNGYQNIRQQVEKKKIGSFHPLEPDIDWNHDPPRDNQEMLYGNPEKFAKSHVAKSTSVNMP
jgi:hypothetical protein